MRNWIKLFEASNFLPIRDWAFDWWIGGNQRTMRAKTEAFIEAEKNQKTEMVNHSDMVTAQADVEDDQLAFYKHGSDTLPIIHRWNGHNILWDGNHRVNADHLRGLTASKCLVTYLDDYFDEDGNLRNPV